MGWAWGWGKEQARGRGCLTSAPTSSNISSFWVTTHTHTLFVSYSNCEGIPLIIILNLVYNLSLSVCRVLSVSLRCVSLSARVSRAWSPGKGPARRDSSGSYPGFPAALSGALWGKTHGPYTTVQKFWATQFFKYIFYYRQLFIYLFILCILHYQRHTDILDFQMLLCQKYLVFEKCFYDGKERKKNKRNEASWVLHVKKCASAAVDVCRRNGTDSPWCSEKTIQLTSF